MPAVAVVAVPAELSALPALPAPVELSEWELEEALHSQLFEDNNKDSRS